MAALAGCRARSGRARRPDAATDAGAGAGRAGAMIASSRALDARPFVAGPVIGWRTWSLSGIGDDVRLLPVTRRRRPWPARTPARAMCGKWHLHQPPEEACTCGLHATREPALLQRTKGPTVVGLVALWGTIVEHEFGYRARFGYPVALRLLCPICFWQRGMGGSSEPTVVASFRHGRPMPLCGRHVATTIDAGVHPTDVVPATDVIKALLAGYGVDLLPSRVGVGTPTQDADPLHLYVRTRASGRKDR